MNFYIFKKGEIIPATVSEWAQWFETDERIIFQDDVDGVQVSTIFLGYSLKHSTPRSESLPQFETLVSGYGYSLKMLTTSYEEALSEHNQAIAYIKGNAVQAFLMRIKPED